MGPLWKLEYQPGREQRPGHCGGLGETAVVGWAPGGTAPTPLGTRLQGQGRAVYRTKNLGSGPLGCRRGLVWGDQVVGSLGTNLLTLALCCSKDLLVVSSV